MIRLKTVILIFLLYLIFYLSIHFNINILSPYYYLKDLIIYPVLALNDNDSIDYSKELLMQIINELRSDLASIKELNNIKTVNSEFEFINASVIERNRMYWFNSLKLDKGTSDGIEVDMAVINENGLIGRINKVSKYTSEVKLITTNDVNNKISVVIINGEEKTYGIMSGYDNTQDCLLITLTNKNIEIKNDSVVQTSGMGGIFPSGILIGKVVNSTLDKYEVSKIVSVKPVISFNNLKYVSVLKRS